MKIRSVTTHLGGAVATYLIVAACSQDGSIAGLSTMLDGSAPTMDGAMQGGSPGDQATSGDAQTALHDAQATPAGGAPGGSPRDAQPLLDGSRSVLDASVLLDAFVSPVPDANAQSCGTCEVPSTLQIKTADTDMARALGGQVVAPSVGAYAAVAFVNGPAIVTNLNIISSAFNRATTFHLIDQGGTCSNSLPSSEGTVHLESGDSYNGRIVVPTNFSLCAVATATDPQGIRVNWSGYRPY
jgi:hypothetical protein